MKRNIKKKMEEKAFVEEITYAPHSIISCEGEKDSLGHPKIYLSLKDGSAHLCPYCSRRFKTVQEDSK